MDRFTHLLKSYSEIAEKRKKDSILFAARKEIEINGNGTSGHMVKTGLNKGKVLGHISVKHRNDI